MDVIRLEFPRGRWGKSFGVIIVSFVVFWVVEFDE